jgi:RNA polymerase sigma-70 factor (ECF subfamily)
LRRYNGQCRLFTWLCAILLNRYRNTLREKRPIPFTSLAGPEGNEVEDRVDRLADPQAWPDEAAAARDQAGLMRECVAALPPKHQQVIWLRFFADDSIEGIAAASGCSAGTVKSRLFHALDKLRAMKALNRTAAEFETKASDL